MPLKLGSDGYGAGQIALVLGVAGLVGVATNLTVGRIFNRFGGIAIGVAAIGLTVAAMPHEPLSKPRREAVPLNAEADDIIRHETEFSG